MAKIFSKSTISVVMLALLALAVAVPAHGGHVNKSVKIAAGSQSSGASSVNGSITVGAGAVVTGDLDTVNGRIRVDSDVSVKDVSTVNGSLSIKSGVTADSLSTVNGSIEVAENVTINGNIEAVNGEIGIDRGSTVARDVSNVNGEIELVASLVGGNLSTVSGDIELSGGAEVRGDIIVEEPGGWWRGNKETRMPEIVIGPRSRVHGNIHLERVVKLYISETAEVGGVVGKMSMSDAVRFSGKRP